MGVLNKISSMFSIGSEEEDEYEDYEEEDDEEDDYVEEPKTEIKVEESKFKKPEKKVVSVPKRRVPMTDSSVCVFKPKSFDESREIVDTFLEDKTVVMNFEGVDLAISQRILDIVTGACIACGGNLQKISNFIFIATPSSVDVSGEFQDSLTGAFDAL